MIVEFKYRTEKSRGEVVYRPAAEVLLEANGKKLLISPYIDSGADITLIPKSAGEILNLKLTKEAMEELSGIGERKVAVIYKMVKMTVGEEIFECRIAWALIEEVPPILGRKDVFEHFAVLFQEWDKKILFIPKAEFTELTI